MRHNTNFWYRRQGRRVRGPPSLSEINLIPQTHGFGFRRDLGLGRHTDAQRREWVPASHRSSPLQLYQMCWIFEIDRQNTFRRLRTHPHSENDALPVSKFWVSVATTSPLGDRKSDLVTVDPRKQTAEALITLNPGKLIRPHMQIET
jgi:hypothetical protein